MFTALLKILVSLYPFLKELFYQEREDRRWWILRTMVVVILGLIVAWLFYKHKHDEFVAIQSQLQHTQTSLTFYQKEYSKLTAERDHHVRLYEDKKDNYDRLYIDYKETIEKLDQCHLEIASIRNRLMEEQRPQSPLESPKDKNKPQRKDRLGGINR